MYPLAAASAVAAMLLAAIITINPPSMASTPPLDTSPALVEHVRDPEWQWLVSRAVETGDLPFPDDVDSGIVVDDARPELTWPARAGATYVVSVFDGDRAIARSEPLPVPRWHPHRELPRGRTLTWQVEVPRRDKTEVIPATPRAMFRVTRVRDHRELANAKSSRADDDVLLAVLYARAGLRDDARDALRRGAAKGDAASHMLLERNFPNAAKKAR